MDKAEKEKFRNSPEFKSKIDKFLQDNLDMSYEDLRVDNPRNRQFIKSIFEVLDVDDEEVSLMDLNLEMPAIVENNEISNKANLSKGDLILAEIYSDPEDGITNEWNFSKIEKIN
jgi:hypothetical protein